MKVSSKPYSDLLIVITVLCIAALLLVPLPTVLLDALIAFNIAFALLLLLIGLSLKDHLSLLTFPAILLLSTLFRLSLNVASTRLILSQGDAGNIIRSFGTFLISDEIAVGVIIFLIITVVNFIVIARGSSRISEVAARFVLDALPGKQMAIDSDLRSGLISAEVARHRREDLRKETQLYGSMDGAMKFVQGDAIAGIFITLTNIFGGIYIGIKQGLGIGEALQTYTTLTVGDGLVTQIPALLVSICAGVIVTRVAGEKNTTLGTDLIRQLFQNRKVLMLAAFVTVLIAMLPGLPIWPFVFIALAFATVAYFVKDPADENIFHPVKRHIRQLSSSNSTVASFHLDYASTDLKILVSKNLYSLYQTKTDYYHTWWLEEQESFKAKYGLQLPHINIVEDRNFPQDTYSIFHKDFEFANGEHNASVCRLDCSPEHLRIFGLKQVEQVSDSATSRKISLVQQSKLLNQVVENCALEYFDAIQHICSQAKQFYLKNPEEIIELTEIHVLLKDIDNRYPGLFADLFENNFLNPARLVELITALSETGLYTTDLKSLLETLAMYCSSYGKSLVDSGEFVVSDIIQYVRENKRREALAPYVASKQCLRIVILDQELKDKCMEQGHGDYQFKKQLLQSLETVYDGMVTKSLEPVVLLVPKEIRAKMNSLLSSLEHSIPVVSFTELDETIQLEPMGIVETYTK